MHQPASPEAVCPPPRIARPTIVARRVLLSGQVQGVGLRPAVARWATELGLAGRACNDSEGVALHVEGTRAALARFLRQLTSRLPPAARCNRLRLRPAVPLKLIDFSIGPPEPGQPPAVPPPLDRAICDECLAETADSRNRRRGGYSFTGCTSCGPRYSLLAELPFAREHTAWASFTWCPDCRREFLSPGDRRYHAETNSCARCGPRVRLFDRRGASVEGDWRPVVTAALRAGQIVALQGVGGYQLLCDAASAAAVARLRSVKHRPQKPLAVLVADRPLAERVAELDAAQWHSLSSPANPIVLVRSRADAPLAARELFPGLREVGLLLPSTALHWLVARDFAGPLVCTSGNRSGQPLLVEPQFEGLGHRSLADLWLCHDRAILRPLDDSVVRLVAGRQVTIRAGRGLAPLPLDLPRWLTSGPEVMALGGEQKSALAWFNGRQAALGPHVGDLDSLEVRRRFLDQVEAICGLYQFQPRLFIEDAHPDYATRLLAERQGWPTQSVQHHQAHVAGLLLEHGLLDGRARAPLVLGVAWDGSGYGTDGTIWGGEFLTASLHGFQRVARLRPIPLVGGEAAILQPWRVTVALLVEAQGPSGLSHPACPAPLNQARQIAELAARPALAPRASSIGRLFDGVAALVLGPDVAGFEGRPAMLLETLAAEVSPEQVSAENYPFPLVETDGARPAELDWRPLVAAIVADLGRAVPPANIAWRFHRTLASAVMTVAARWPLLPVALSGGVFQNCLLTEMIAAQFANRREAQRLLLPGQIPPGDGGLAAGQLVIGLARAASGATSNKE